MTIRILLADDHQMFREGLKSLVESQSDMKIVSEADNGRTAVKLALELKPEIVIMDITMPELNGIEAAAEIRKALPDTRVIGLSMHSDKRFVKKMLEAGASGFLLKSCAAIDLVQAIRAVHAHKTYFSEKVLETIIEDYSGADGGIAGKLEEKKLSHREAETLQLMAEGKSTKEIGSILNISIKSVEVYKKQLMQKLNLKTTADVVKYAIREGITTAD